MSTFCPKCGMPVPDGIYICSQCGTSLGDVTQAVSPLMMNQNAQAQAPKPQPQAPQPQPAVRTPVKAAPQKPAQDTMDLDSILEDFFKEFPSDSGKRSGS